MKIFFCYFLVVGKLKTVSVDVVEKRSIRVSWRLDCSDRVGIVTGYRISYCRVESMARPEICLEDDVSTHEAPPDAEHAWINDLEPYTVYKVMMSVCLSFFLFSSFLSFFLSFFLSYFFHVLI